jgi:hypothetical protein
LTGNVHCCGALSRLRPDGFDYPEEGAVGGVAVDPDIGEPHRAALSGEGL